MDAFSGWSKKAGLWHAIAPDGVLKGMVALRLQLDGCDSGALEVVPGSHGGSLGEGEIRSMTHLGVPLALERGDVLVLRPLLLHRSGRVREGARRRVLHVEYAAEQLPPPLEWAYWR